MEDSFIDLKQLSTRLSLSARTIRKWTKDPERPLPCYGVGGKLLFSWEEVDAWVRRFKVEPADRDEVVRQILADMKGKSNGSTEKASAV